MRFPVRTSAAVICAALGLSACGSSHSSSNSGGSSPATKAVTSGSTASGSSGLSLNGRTIAYIETGSIPYYEYTAKGVQAAVSYLGGSTKVLNSNFSAQTELANVQNALAQQVSGIVLEPLSAASTRAELRLTKAANIPTAVLYGYSPSVADDAVGFVQTQYEDTGAAAGNEMKKLASTGQLAIITGTQGRGDASGYTAGFEKAIGNKSRIVSVLDGNYDRQTASNDAQDLITKYPNLKGIFVHNEDMAIGVINALGAKAKQVTIVTQNGSPEGEPFIAKGAIKASIGWSPSMEGEFAVRDLANSLAHRSVSPKLCLTPYAIDTPQDPTKSVRWLPTSTLVEQALKTKCMS